jgi:hypothetical protein
MFQIIQFDPKHFEKAPVSGAFFVSSTRRHAEGADAGPHPGQLSLEKTLGGPNQGKFSFEVRPRFP